MSAVYWVIANVPPKYRSTLHSIQLAVLCKSSHVKEFGYAKILRPLIHDLASLEQHGVYVEKLGESVKGTVLYVAADNLAAHSLAGFFESFMVDRFCRFCMATRGEVQGKEVFMEFSRIVGKNLKQEFYESIDRHSPRLLELFQSKRGNVGQLLTQISQQTNTTEPTTIWTQVLRGLPIILGDNPTNFFKASFESDDDDYFR
ncbi:uncharacterized protein LOC119886565 isoform X1 [Micropterus salmoides]|uniref:uncharacterized protein LOC119886565 isoform X1 n=1 Tax=Micropterus salmoides TaxID=27706 RepID=UPI0018EDCA74|nr:uncharacterized protein LOC119886565 isoform X1 [Micropterus salmoides]